MCGDLDLFHQIISNSGIRLTADTIGEADLFLSNSPPKDEWQAVSSSSRVRRSNPGFHNLPARLAPEAGGQHIKLGGSGAACGRLDMAHGGKRPLQAGKQLVLGAALQDFGEKGAARR